MYTFILPALHTETLHCSGAKVMLRGCRTGLCHENTRTPEHHHQFSYYVHEDDNDVPGVWSHLESNYLRQLGCVRLTHLSRCVCVRVCVCVCVYVCVCVWVSKCDGGVVGGGGGGGGGGGVEGMMW